MTLASAQFLMTLHSSVMNVSIATVAKDVATTVTGIQLAIMLYTLVMATFMITGGKVGQLLGRKRAVLIGVLTTTFLGSVAANSAIPEELSAQAQVEPSSGVPFVSDADLDAALDKAGVQPATAQAIVDENRRARSTG